MIFGTPIITTFVGGISVIMEDNINSLKIEAKSIDSVVEKLEQALGNYLEMGRLAIKATETIRKIVDKNRLTHGQHLNEIIK